MTSRCTNDAVRMQRPRLLPVALECVPTELKACSQWVVWRLVRRQDRWAKVPFDPATLRPARTNDASTWGPFDRALARYGAGEADGIGFVFSKDDPYAGIDLDNCRDPVSGDIAPWASDVLERVRSYTEVSPSGTGVKIVVRGKLPCAGTGRRRRVRDVPAQDCRTPEIEAYHYGRYFALTGIRVDGTPPTIETRQAELRSIWDRFFTAPTDHRGAPEIASGLSAAPFLRDAELLDLARQARTGARFCQLYDAGGLDSYDGDHSRADLALCSMLAFWTHGDGTRIDRLFRQSALMRPKWDERHAADGATYGGMTVRRVLGS